MRILSLPVAYSKRSITVRAPPSSTGSVEPRLQDVAMNCRRDERGPLAVFVRQGRVEPGSVGLPTRQWQFGQHSRVEHRGLGDLDIVECPMVASPVGRSLVCTTGT
jgi:hypothetical protein